MRKFIINNNITVVVIVVKLNYNENISFKGDRNPFQRQYYSFQNTVLNQTH